MDEYPINRDFIDPEMLSRLSRLQIHTRKPMSGSFTGLHKSTHKGSSTEFSQYRNYTRGDDISLIDWKVYGRSDKLFVKEFDADTNMRVYVLLDCSASMLYKSDRISKFSIAKKLAASVAHLAIQQGDAVSLNCFSSETNQYIAPKTSPKHLRAILDILANSQAKGENNIGQAVEDLAARAPRRGMVILISDLFEDIDVINKALSHLAFQKHDLSVFHVLDENELKFDFEKPTTFMDMETGVKISANPQLIKIRYQNVIGNYLREVKDSCFKTGVDYRLVINTRSCEDVLAEFLLGRIQV